MRSYIKFKDTFCTEYYVNEWLTRQQRSILAQFRAGVLQLRIETGRYIALPVEDRICELCHQGIEDECHFLLQCPLYDKEHKILIEKCIKWVPNLLELNNDTKFTVIMANEYLYKLIAKFLVNAWNMRSAQLFKYFK